MGIDEKQMSMKLSITIGFWNGEYVLLVDPTPQVHHQHAFIITPVDVQYSYNAIALSFALGT